MRPRTAGLPWLLLTAALVASCSDDATTAPPPASPYQPAAYREAARITAAGALAAMARARTAQTEGYVKAIIDGVFLREGCIEPAFESIVAAGPHATELHYFGNDGVLRGGELLLLDIGATSDEIASDCSRTLPVGPAFSARQRELYDLVLEVYQQVTTGVRPGVDALDDLDSVATVLFRASPLRALDDSGTERTMDVFFLNYLGHYVGMSVHGEDTGWSRHEPFAVGQVVALEPGLYLSSEEIGIRVEDTFLVTGQGLECLTCGCPKQVAEIEALRAAVTTPFPLTAESRPPSR